MFKKVVLSGLLLGAIIFPLGLNVSAEVCKTEEEIFCEDLYGKVKWHLENYMRKIGKAEKKRDELVEMKSDLKALSGEFPNYELWKSELPSSWSQEKVERFGNITMSNALETFNEKIRSSVRKTGFYKNRIKRLLEILDDVCPGFRDKKGEKNFSEKVLGWQIGRILEL